MESECVNRFLHRSLSAQPPGLHPLLQPLWLRLGSGSTYPDGLGERLTWQGLDEQHDAERAGAATAHDAAEHVVRVVRTVSGSRRGRQCAPTLRPHRRLGINICRLVSPGDVGGHLRAWRCAAPSGSIGVLSVVLVVNLRTANVVTEHRYVELQETASVTCASPVQEVSKER